MFSSTGMLVVLIKTRRVGDWIVKVFGEGLSLSPKEREGRGGKYLGGKYLGCCSMHHFP